MSAFGALALVVAFAGPPAQEAVGTPPVKIHEVLAGPAGYLDLHNTGATAVELGGWSIQSCDGASAPVELAQLPAGSLLPAGGHFLIAGQGFGGSTAQQMIVSAIPGDGETLLDHRRARVDSVGWTAGSGCREKEAAAPCPGFALSRDALSSDTDDNKVDFGCVRPLD